MKLALYSYLVILLILIGSSAFAQVPSKHSAPVGTPSPILKRDPPLRPNLRPLINPNALPKLDPSTPNRIRGDMRKGGDWQSSGGTGVACFDSQKNAELFDKVVQANKPLSDELIAHIRSLKASDIWEAEGLLTNFFFDSSKPEEQILSELELRLAKSASLFYFQLEATKTQIFLESWTEEGALTPTKDAQLNRKFSADESLVCRQIQLAVRIHKKTAVDVMPKVHVFFDPRLYKKMDSLNRAALNLHERIYLLGRQVGHPDSLNTRYLTAGLMNSEFWRTNDVQDIGVQAMVVQNAINGTLGDYIHVLFQTLSAGAQANSGTSGSRLLSLRSALHKIRAVTDVCNHSGKYAEDVRQRACLNEGIQAGSSGELYDSFTDEESFVFLSRWVLTEVLPHTPNVELQMVDWEDAEMKRLAKWSLESHCGLLLYLQNDGKPTRFKLEKPARYCSSLGMKPIEI